MAVLARNYDPADWGMIPHVPRDPAYVGVYVRAGESLRGAIRRELRRDIADVSVGLRVGPDGRTYAVLRVMPDRDRDCYESDYRVRAEREAVWIRMPPAVDRAVRERGATGNHEGLGFTLCAVPHKFLYEHWGLWR